MYIDAHCHLEERTYRDELDDVIQRAFDAGLTHMVAVGATRVAEGAREVLRLRARDSRIYITLGIHPHDAEAATDDDIRFVVEHLDEERVVSLGEIGLDYYYDHSPKERQKEVFRELLGVAKERNIPAMLHIRDAHEDCWEILDEVGLPQRGGVVHCFTAGPKEAGEYLRRGMYLSIPGVVTFKNSTDLQEAVKVIPEDRFLIETDCPYLAPVPFRGKRNEPSYVTYTAAKVAELRGSTPEAVGQQARENTMRLFEIADSG